MTATITSCPEGGKTTGISPASPDDDGLFIPALFVNRELFKVSEWCGRNEWHVPEKISPFRQDFFPYFFFRLLWRPPAESDTNFVSCLWCFVPIPFMNFMDSLSIKSCSTLYEAWIVSISNRDVLVDKMFRNLEKNAGRIVDPLKSSNPSIGISNFPKKKISSRRENWQ